MALLVKKFSSLPFIAARVPGSGVESYIMARTFATRRSANDAVKDDKDETTTDEDDEIPDSLELQVEDAIYAGTAEESDIQCRVALPIRRRAWATSQDENAVRFRMDMPGIAKENVKVYVDDWKLVVKGKYAQAKENVDDELGVLADNVGVYFAELDLPDNVEIDKIKSQMKDGMLVVTAPKEVTNILVE